MKKNGILFNAYKQLSLDTITHRYVAENMDKFIELDDKGLLELQQCLLGMLKDIDAACRKYGIEYAITGGNVLGKVRHNGFIPWDDDIDLVMPRADYEKFMKVFDDSLLADDYILRAPGYKGGADFRCMKIYKKDSYMEFAFHKKYVQKKIFIDVMPFDNVPDSGLRRSLKNIYCDILIVILGCIDVKKNFDDALKREMKKTPLGVVNYCFRAFFGALFGLIPQNKWYTLYNKAPQYKRKTNYGTVYNGKLLYKGEIVPWDYYMPFHDCDYCGVKTKIINRPETYLQFRYGDYKTIPDRAHRETHIVKKINVGSAEP